LAPFFSTAEKRREYSSMHYGLKAVSDGETSRISATVTEVLEVTDELA
jgi:hypothetical protein